MRNTVGTQLNYDPEEDFDYFLGQLRSNSQLEWTWLFQMFRERVVPWLFKKDGNLPKEAIVATEEFIEEIFANCLFQFYELFAKGEFHNMADLRGLIFRIGEYKLKEGYHHVKRDSLIYFTDDLTNDGSTEVQDQLTVEEYNERDSVGQLREFIEQLSPIEQKILIRYSKGEELGSIASNLGISAAACRKRKQRALEKLKELVTK
jgi:RNA polymerase sigma factor (sigma-70 family)